MAVALRYDIKGADVAHNALSKLASQYENELDSSIENWTKEERAYLKRFGYPPQKGGKQPFKSDRQRRFFFWALSNGVIQVPYQRTGRLASSWRSRKIGQSHYALENTAAYAALVVGSNKQQARYHKDWWWTAESVIQEDSQKLTEDITENLVDLADM